MRFNYMRVFIQVVTHWVMATCNDKTHTHTHTCFWGIVASLFYQKVSKTHAHVTIQISLLFEHSPKCPKSFCDTLSIFLTMSAANETLLASIIILLKFNSNPKLECLTTKLLLFNWPLLVHRLLKEGIEQICSWLMNGVNCFLTVGAVSPAYLVWRG